MSYTKDQMIDEMDSIDRHEEDRRIDEARLTFSDVPAISDDAYYEPTLEQRKIVLVNRVKDIAPDWDEMTARELLHLMAVSKVTFTPDAELYVRQECNV